MNKLFKSIVLTLAFVFMAGLVGAASITDHVKVAPGNKGDVLIFPFYAAIDGGWETKVTVVNTSKTDSTVAKVIVRSPVFSEEILDFFIYLSPTDVWTGTLKYDPQVGTVLESDDDSIVARLGAQNRPVFGDEEIARRALVAATGPGDFNEMGYLYVINIASFTGIIDGTNFGNPPVDKVEIYNLYRSLTPGGTVPEEYLPKNILAGWMDFQVAGFGLTSSLNAVTLSDYQNDYVADIQLEYQLGDANANNTLFEIEAALSKNNIAMPYLNNEDLSMHFLTFPTKYTDFDNTGAISVRSGYLGFDSARNFCVRYTLNLFDTTEDSLTPEDPIWSPTPPAEFNDLCNELNWVVSTDSPFAEGWINYNFNFPTAPTPGQSLDGNFMTYTGAPVIPVTLNLGASGMSLKYGAWTDGTVTLTLEEGFYEVPYYQYSDLGWLD